MTGIAQTTHADRVASIRTLNDEFRKTLHGGRLHITRSLLIRTEGKVGELILAIAAFDDFTADNDPYKEHDFGSLTWKGDVILWKIDCYDLDMSMASPDPADPTVTRRVLTVMLAEDY
jgi:hypothetical protein